MRPYESDVYEPNRELNHSHKSEVVPFDVEYIVLIPYIINAIKSLFYISKTTPFALLNFLHPVLQSDL